MNMTIGTCLLCFAENTKIFDIKNTKLQSVCEDISDSKIQNDSHCLCYICRAKLHQCHVLIKQMLNLHKDLQDDSNETEDKCLVRLSTIKLKNTSVDGVDPPNKVSVKKEPNDLEDGKSNYDLLAEHHYVCVNSNALEEQNDKEISKTTKVKRRGRPPKKKIGRPKTSDKTRKEQQREASRRYRAKRQMYRRMAKLNAEKKTEDLPLVHSTLTMENACIDGGDPLPFYCVTVKEEPHDVNEEHVKSNPEDFKYEVKIEPCTSFIH